MVKSKLNEKRNPYFDCGVLASVMHEHERVCWSCEPQQACGYETPPLPSEASRSFHFSLLLICECYYLPWCWPHVVPSHQLPFVVVTAVCKLCRLGVLSTPTRIQLWFATAISVATAIKLHFRVLARLCRADSQPTVLSRLAMSECV
jgi:hypothetical protein